MCISRMKRDAMKVGGFTQHHHRIRNYTLHPQVCNFCAAPNRIVKTMTVLKQFSLSAPQTALKIPVPLYYLMLKWCLKGYKIESLACLGFTSWQTLNTQGSHDLSAGGRGFELHPASVYNFWMHSISEHCPIHHLTIMVCRNKFLKIQQE